MRNLCDYRKLKIATIAFYRNSVVLRQYPRSVAERIGRYSIMQYVMTGPSLT